MQPVKTTNVLENHQSGNNVHQRNLDCISPLFLNSPEYDKTIFREKFGGISVNKYNPNNSDLWLKLKTCVKVCNSLQIQMVNSNRVATEATMGFKGKSNLVQPEA